MTSVWFTQGEWTLLAGRHNVAQPTAQTARHDPQPQSVVKGREVGCWGAAPEPSWPMSWASPGLTNCGFCQALGRDD